MRISVFKQIGSGRIFAAFFLSLSMALTESVSAAEMVATTLDKNGNPIADVIVYATPLHGSVPPVTKTATAVISQSGMQFSPYVTAVRVGTAVEFPNYDKMEHHVKSFSAAKEFEIKTYEKGVTPPPVLFDKAGMVVVYCLLHNWMRAYVLVLDTPYFAKSDGNGFVKLENVPVGDYKLEAWHPNMGSIKPPLSRNVKIGTDNLPTQFQFDFVPITRKSK
ncbi:methylamine utilization protein [Undibacterium sp. Ji67W]|uniref:methylamine utilization protein n=1 Tax=Undibacterium sp. Ji67W TaxID=3413042 RepID=UPI003BF15772